MHLWLVIVPYDLRAGTVGMGCSGGKAVFMRIRDLVPFWRSLGNWEAGGGQGPYILGFGSGAIRKYLGQSMR